MPDADRVTPAAELASLYPQPRTITVAGRSIAIKRCGIAQAGRIIDAAMPLYAETQGDMEILPLFDERPEQVTAIIAAATGLDSTWVATLDAADKFAIATAWMEANAAFFVQRLLPNMASFIATMATLGGGPTSSTSSSSAGT